MCLVGGFVNAHDLLETAIHQSKSETLKYICLLTSDSSMDSFRKILETLEDVYFKDVHCSDVYNIKTNFFKNEKLSKCIIVF